MEASIIITLNRPKSPNYLIPCSSDPLQPVPLIPRSPLLSLSAAPCLLYSVFFVPSCLSGQDPRSTLVETPLQITPFLQNKPNFLNGKTTATSYATQIYSNIPLHPSPKEQTQTKPILQRNTRYN